MQLIHKEVNILCKQKSVIVHIPKMKLTKFSLPSFNYKISFIPPFVHPYLTKTSRMYLIQSL